MISPSVAAGFPPCFADLHNHTVPGVDDGSRSLGETLAAMRAFAGQGVTGVTVTPHLLLPELAGQAALMRRLDELRSSFDRMQSCWLMHRSPPQLFFGQEVWAADAASVQRVAANPDVGLAGTRFMLIEFGFDLRQDPLPVIETVRAAGREILIAHPERYRFPTLRAGRDAICRWRDAGAFLQVNLGSLVDWYGPENEMAARLSWQLIEDGLVHVLASDHHCENRPQIIHRSVFELLERRGAAGVARRLLSENPWRILADTTPLEASTLEAVAA